MSFLVCIPARYGSTRLPGKALLKIGGKTLVRRVYEKCAKTSTAEIIVATDDRRIEEEVKSFGGRACLTDESIRSGSDRVAAALEQLSVSEETIVVNVQGDEPFVPPKVIEQVATGVANAEASVHTVCEPLSSGLAKDINVVKVVRDKLGRALYFSRSNIPWSSNGDGGISFSASSLRKHVGIYGYTRKVLKTFVSTKPSDLELTERLEQLRFLYNGIKIFVPDAYEPCGIGVDTIEDYEEACKLWVSGALGDF